MTSFPSPSNPVSTPTPALAVAGISPAIIKPAPRLMDVSRDASPSPFMVIVQSDGLESVLDRHSLAYIFIMWEPKS